MYQTNQTNQKRNFGRALLLGLLAAGGCVAEVGDEGEWEIEEQSEDLLYRSTSLWNRRDVAVCWTGNVASYAAEKEIVRKVILGQRSWAAEANVRFTGWGVCPAGLFSGVTITPVLGAAATEVGPNGNDNVVMNLDFRTDMQVKYSSCQNNGLSRDNCLRSVALHEFGHALGLGHEQNRDSVNPCALLKDNAAWGDATYGTYDANSLLNYCSGANDLSGLDRTGVTRLYGRAYADSERHLDFDKDGRADMLCADGIGGPRALQSVANGAFTGSKWTANHLWCSNANQRLFKGDFNGDKRVDLLCHDIVNGSKWIDYADSVTGQFTGTNWSRASNWCVGQKEGLLIGDFNGDGRSDMLCHDTVGGTKWIDFADANGQFLGTDWSAALGWCIGNSSALFVGDFNGDLRDDMLCHEVTNGKKWVDLADAAGKFAGTDTFADLGWCGGPNQELLVGDFNGNQRDDLLCYDTVTGTRWVDLATAGGVFAGTDWQSGADKWCTHNAGRVSVGDFDGDWHDDILCRDVATGNKWLDLASANGTFEGTNIFGGNWCSGVTQELH